MLRLGYYNVTILKSFMFVLFFCTSYRLKSLTKILLIIIDVLSLEHNLCRQNIPCKGNEAIEDEL